MKHDRKILPIIAIVTFFLSGDVAHAMTLDEALENLATHRFGQNDEALNFLRDAAVTSHSDPALRKKLNDGLVRILDSDAAYDARQFACRQLALTATEEHIPVLARQLGDEKMSHMALYVLAHIEGPEIDKALLLALETATGNARLGIINMLGNRRCAGAAEPLGKLMVSDDEHTSIAAIRALGRIGTDAAYSQFVLYDVADDPPGRLSHAMKMALAHANLDFADRFLADGKPRQAEQRYRIAFDEQNPAHIRAAGLKGLAATMGEQAGPFVTQALKSGNKQLQGMAATIIRTVPQKDTAEAMAAEFPEMEPRIQVLLMNALTARTDGAGIAIVKTACTNPQDPVREAALRALGSIGDESCVSLLLAHATGDSEQSAALDSLISLPGENVNAILIQRLRDSDRAEKAVICRALLGRDAAEAAPVLVETARTADRSVRAEALKALHNLAGPRQMPALVDLILVVEPAEADQIGKALAAVARRNSIQRECAEVILSRYRRAANTDRQAALLMTLGELGHELALPKLREALHDDESQIRYAAIKALSSWPDPAPADDLLEVAKSADNPTHRVLALRGFIDLIDAAELPADRKLAHYQDAMRLADQDPERKKVLSVLAGLDTLEAFRMAVSYLDDPSLKNEAALAACRIAQRIHAENRQAWRGRVAGVPPARVEGVSPSMRGPEALATRGQDARDTQGRDALATRGQDARDTQGRDALATVRQVKDGLERIVAADVSDSAKQQAREILQDINKVDFYVTEWEVSGPYVQKGKNYAALFDTAFAPEIDGGKDAEWRRMPAGTDPAQSWYLDLLKALDRSSMGVPPMNGHGRDARATVPQGSEQLVAYLRTTLEWPAEQRVTLRIGSDDGVKLWVNGQLVHANNVARPFTLDQDTATATFKKGRNIILMKITQNNMPWGASLRIEHRLQ